MNQKKQIIKYYYTYSNLHYTWSNFEYYHSQYRWNYSPGLFLGLFIPLYND